MSGTGGGEVRLEFLDDVQRSTAKVNGKFLKFDSSVGKFVGDDAGGNTTTLVEWYNFHSTVTTFSIHDRILSLPDKTGLISLVGGITTVG